jgi:predicted Zn-dependent protease
MKTYRILLPLAALTAAVSLAAFPGLGGLGDLVDKVDKGAKSAKHLEKGAAGLSLEDEIAIGDAVALQIVDRYGGVWRNSEAFRRVNIIGRVLGRYSQRQDLDWRFGVLNSDEINAFSAPGGRVFITRGLYKLVANDDELAGVLGHEIEHIDRRHALKIIARGELFEGIKGAATVAGKYDPAKYDQAVSTVVSNLLDKGYDSGTEYDADKYGRNLAAVSGFAPGGLRAVIEKLQQKSAAGSGKVFSTHPSAENRLKKLPADPAPGGAAKKP